MITIRLADINDDALLAKFIVKLDNESEYLLYEPGERMGDIDHVRSFLLRINQDNKSVIYIALNDATQQIVGFACGEVYRLKRLSHVMKVNIGILNDYQRQGLGQKLGEKLLDHSRHIGILRIEAAIIMKNVASISLVEKLGFKIEGIKTNAVMINHLLYDVCIIAKLNT